MNLYRSIGNAIGSREALELAERLSSWHDAMVGHERLARVQDVCDDECPHGDAGPLWIEASRTFGARADELRFLRSRGAANSRRAARRAAPPAEARA